MRVLLLSILFSVSLSSFAQVKPIYFRGDEIISDSTRATSYGVYGKLSGEDLYALKIFDLYNNLKVSGTYKDDELKVPHGTFIYYEDIDVFNTINNENFPMHGIRRFISGRGAFVTGLKNGRWLSFFPDGKILNVTTYVNGVKHGFFGTYSRKGKVVTSGVYMNDKKEGEWLSNNGKTKENFVNNVKQVESKHNIN